MIANFILPKQCGYLTRQNTKIVVATSDNTLNDVFYTDDDSKSSKLKQSRSQSWIVEPWVTSGRNSSDLNKLNASDRFSSAANSKTVAQRRVISQGSRISDFSTLDDGSERGRLFVKVLGVKDLDLPLPKSELS